MLHLVNIVHKKHKHLFILWAYEHTDSVIAAEAV